MTSDLWSAAADALHAVAGAYVPPPPKPTIEELTSELEVVRESHRHANRALENMAVALSDAMDRRLACEDELRKTKLAYDKVVKDLTARVEKLEEIKAKEQP